MYLVLNEWDYMCYRKFKSEAWSTFSFCLQALRRHSDQFNHVETSISAKLTKKL